MNSLQNLKTNSRFSPKAVLATVTYAALLLGIWKYIGTPWTVLISGLVLLFVILCATGVWRRPPIACPACQQRTPAMFFTPRYPCPNCQTDLQSDNRASRYCCWVFFAVLGLPLIALNCGEISFRHFLLVWGCSCIILGMVARYYTRAVLADDSQVLSCERPLMIFNVNPKHYWLAMLGVTAIASLSAGTFIGVMRKNWAAGVGFGGLMALAMMIVVCSLYFNFLDLWVRSPVRVPAKHEIYARWKIVLVSLMAGLATLHFGLGVHHWLYYTFMPHGLPLDYSLPFAWICFTLLGLSLLTFVQSLRRRKSAVWLLAILLLSGTLGFWYDARNERFQVSVFATKEYFDNGGRGYIYFNWPLYDPSRSKISRALKYLAKL